MFDPYSEMFCGYSTNDGTVDFYTRLKCFLRPDHSVLDLGAGRAAWYDDDKNSCRREIRTLKGKVKKVVAVDVDEAVLKNQSADECLVMHGGNIPLADKSVDMVVSDYVLEHIQDVKSFVAEVNRVLKPGGLFCARTPHKWCYVSVAARLVENARHSRVLSRVQPERKAEDVFPTAYKLNTLKEVRQAFAGFDDASFIYRADPAYYFGSRVMYRFQEVFHRLAPAFFSGNLFIFLRKKN